MRRNILYILVGTLAVLVGSACFRLGQSIDGNFFYFGFLFLPMGASFLAIGIVMILLEKEDSPIELATG